MLLVVTERLMTWQLHRVRRTRRGAGDEEASLCFNIFSSLDAHFALLQLRITFRIYTIGCSVVMIYLFILNSSLFNQSLAEKIMRTRSMWIKPGSEQTRKMSHSSRFLLAI